MRRRSFLGLAAGVVFTVLTAKVPVFAGEDFNSYAKAPRGLLREVYTPLTDEQITEMVARSVAHTSYRNWNEPPYGPPVTGRVRHSFTELAPWETERAYTYAEHRQLDEARATAERGGHTSVH